MAAALLAAVACLGCGLNEFDVTVAGSATVAGSTLGSLLVAFPQLDGFDSLKLTQSQAFKNQGVSASQVQSVKLTALKLTIGSPPTQDFSFLDNIAFLASAGGSPVQVAHLEGISSLDLPAPNPTLTLDMDGPELVGEVTAPSMTLTTQASGREPSQDTLLTATAVFHVVAKL